MIPSNATPPTAIIDHPEGSGTTDTTASPNGTARPDEAGVNRRSRDGIVFANREWDETGTGQIRGKSERRRD
jgi:hypothetical protein